MVRRDEDSLLFKINGAWWWRQSGANEFQTTGDRVGRWRRGSIVESRRFYESGRHWIGSALIDIAALWCAIAVSWCSHGVRRQQPASCLPPFLLWVGFAAVRDLRIWQLNP
jgi:TspO/MBR family